MVSANSKEEVAQAKVFKEKYGVKLEFPPGWVGGGGANQKTLHGGGDMDLFLEADNNINVFSGYPKLFF